MSIVRRTLGRLWRARSAVSVGAAWAALYLVVLLLLALALLESATRPPAEAVRLDPLPEPLVEPRIGLRGQTEPMSMVVVEIDGRLAKLLVADTIGRFDAPLTLPAGARAIEVTASRGGEELGSAALPLVWAAGTFEPRVDLCLVLAGEDLAWLAGVGTPGETLRAHWGGWSGSARPGSSGRRCSPW